MTISVKDKWIAVEGLQIHYLQGGRAGSPVLLLHGGALDSARVSYKYIIGALARKHRVFAPDLPGHGESDMPDIEYTNEFYIRFIERFMDALGLRKSSLVGLSVTGASAIGFTLQSPRKVAKLVLIDSYGLGSAPFGIMSYFLVHMPFLLEARWSLFAWSPDVVRWGLSNIMCRPEAANDEVAQEVYQLARKPEARRSWISFQRSESTLRGLRTNYLDRLREIPVPTLIIHCEKDDAAPVAWARRAHKMIKGSELKIISGCSHWAPREKPEEFNQALLSFLIR